MALKGTTKIELTNIKTGEKEVIEKTNLVTNAAQLAMSQNLLGVMYHDHDGWFSKNMLPVCPNAIGGIMCFEKSIAESVDQIYPPVGNHMTACSSNDVNPGESTVRGSMNQTESGPLEDWSGYRFVFDFGTGQGNGTISSVSLTSKWGGIAGMGNQWESNAWAQRVYQRYGKEWDGKREQEYAWLHVKTLDSEKNTATAAYIDNNGDIHISKLSIQINSLKLVYPKDNDTLEPNWDTFETIVIVPSAVFKSFKSGANPNTKYNIAIHDGDDGYWWAFANAGNSTGNCTVYYMKISQEDYSVEEGSFTNEAKLSPCGEMGGFGYGNNSTSIHDVIRSAVSGGKLYAMNYSKNAIYEIDLVSGIVLNEITSPYQMSTGSSGGSTPTFELRNIAGFIYNRGCIIGGDDVIYKDGDEIRGSIVLEGVYAIRPYKESYGRIMTEVYLIAPYMATINNLASPVEKTADKTMKITYILREEYDAAEPDEE